jgi:hypothetical protein
MLGALLGASRVRAVRPSQLLASRAMGGVLRDDSAPQGKGRTFQPGEPPYAGRSRDVARGALQIGVVETSKTVQGIVWRKLDS